MHKIVKKSTLLSASVLVMVMGVMALPSMASAANWGVAGSVHTLNPAFSTTISVDVVGGTGNMTCYPSGIGLTAKVRIPQSVMDITSATGFSCTGWPGMNDQFRNCNIAVTASALPWTMDGASTTNVKLNSVSYSMVFTPALASTCIWTGTWPLTGTLAGGVWNAPTHSVSWSSGTGLFFSPWGLHATITGTVKDAIQTLTLT